MNKIEQNQEDKKFVSLALQDSGNYDYIIKKYEQRLLNYIQKLIFVNREDAEDILQEVFIKAYINLNSYNSKYNFSGWIYRIAHNEAISFIRKRKNEIMHVVNIQEEVFNTIASEVDLEKDLQKFCTKKNVHRVLDKLDKKYKDVLVLRYIEEMNYEEISDVLHKSPGTVASLINRGKAEFKKLITNI